MNLKTVIRFLKTAPLMVPVLAGINSALWLIDRFAIWTSPVPKTDPNALLVIKVDLLGDYILFRAYLRYLKQHPTYQQYRLTFVGNIAFRQIAQYVDADLVNRFIWVDIYKLTTNPRYRFQTVRQIRQTGYALTFCPSYSRVLVLDDFLALASGAPIRIGCVPDSTNAKPWEVWLGNRCYTQLLPTIPQIMFEAERNREIISELLHEEVPLLSVGFPHQFIKVPVLPPPYMIISPGAGAPDKIWPMARFAEILTYLNDKYPTYKLVITGTPAEQPLMNELRHCLPVGFPLIDKVGKLTQEDLITVVAHAHFVLANDSGIVHIAAALNVTCMSLSAGKSLVRWHPYPAAMTTCIHYVYPEFFDRWKGRFDELAPQVMGIAPVSIQTLDVARVKEAIDNCLLERLEMSV